MSASFLLCFTRERAAHIMDCLQERSPHILVLQSLSAKMLHSLNRDPTDRRAPEALLSCSLTR